MFTGIKPEWIQEWADEVGKRIPALSGLHAELTRASESLVHRLLESMQLVTREEWDVQTQVLQRTRAQLVQLEERVAELERLLPVDVSGKD